MTKLDQLRQLVESLTAPEALAEQFCELDDDAQAQFFVHVARLMAEWNDKLLGRAAGEMQAYFIGRHLAVCECSTEEARRFVRNVASAIEESKDLPKEAA